MKTLTKTLVCLTALLLGSVAAEMALAQDLHPSRRPSPMGMARTFLGDTYIRVIYGRPYERDLDNIFGTKESEALVPYGEMWRTGANEATEITITDDVMVAGKKLAAGTYSLFTTPGPDSWTFHFHSRLGLSGTAYFNPETREVEPGYMPENDVLVVTAKPTTLEEEDKVEQLTFSFENVDDGVHMILRWITTEVRVPITPAG